METFRDILSNIDDNGIEKLEKVRDYILRNNFDKIPICHITDHINTMIENLFHESNENFKEDCIELRKLLLHWYDVRHNEDKCEYKLPIIRSNTSIEVHI